MANKVQNCCQCGTELFPVLEEKLIDGKAVPSKLGPPLESANRAELLLVSGRTCKVTLCDDCLSAPDMKTIWAEVLGAFENEKGMSRTADEGVDAMKRMIFSDPPLGVLQSIKWKDAPR